MSKVALIAKFTALDGKRDELAEAFRGLLSAVESEAGTEIYAVHADASDPNVIWFYELYADQDALMAHGGSEAMKAIGPTLSGLLAGRAELFFLNPLFAKGLAF